VRFVLGLDSASPSPAIALVRDAGAAGGALEEDCEALAHGAAELLVRRLRALLERAGTDVASLDRVAVVSGPGSFTGLRAGIAFARGLARGRGIPLVSVPTFEAASAARPAPARAAFLLDAGRGDVHAAWRAEGDLEEVPRPLPQERAVAEAAARGLSVIDLDTAGLPLAAAAARLALAAPEREPMLVRYGRPSAAEEKREKLLARGAL
jgi:tRNA threonylcarbamoyladenosine biosynthesis protein TsaB